MAWTVGQRVVFNEDVDRFPHFIVEAGTTGTVSWVHENGRDFTVRVDGDVPGLTDSMEWAGEFQIYPTNDGIEPSFLRPVRP